MVGWSEIRVDIIQYVGFLLIYLKLICIHHSERLSSSRLQVDSKILV